MKLKLKYVRAMNNVNKCKRTGCQHPWNIAHLHTKFFDCSALATI